MFNQTSLKFALGLMAIILVSLGIIYLLDHFQDSGQSAPSAVIQ